MSQATQTFRGLSRTTPTTLPAPRQPLTPEQQIDALRRVQAQADQRVKLGLQLFKAAEAHTSGHRQLLDEVKAEQSKFRAEMQGDLSKSLESYDLAMEKMEDDLTGKLRALEDKIARLQDDWKNAQGKIEGMLKRSESMLDQGRSLVEGSTPTRVPSVSPGAKTQKGNEGIGDDISEDETTGSEPGDGTLATPRSPIYTHIIAKLREHEGVPPAA